MTSTTIDIQVKTYIAAVAARLADLPADERDDLMTDLEQHLHEVAAEGEGTLTERLGSPESYAAELRASAGLSPSDHVRRRLWADLRERVRRLPFVNEALGFTPELRAGWWLLRAAIAGGAIAMIAAEDSGRDTKLIFGVVSTALLAVPSILLGRSARHSTAARWLSILGNVPMVILGLALLSNVHVGDAQPAYYEEVYANEFLHHEDMTPITNICAYSSSLRPLKRVLLFDQEGRPIDNVLNEFDESGVRDPGFANLFPLKRQTIDPETGTMRSFRCPTIADGADEKTPTDD